MINLLISREVKLLFLAQDPFYIFSRHSPFTVAIHTSTTALTTSTRLSSTIFPLPITITSWSPMLVISNLNYRQTFAAPGKRCNNHCAAMSETKP